MSADDRRPPLPPPAHPDLDTLADLHADALDASTAERVRAHASSCSRCGPVLAALDGVRAELRALPVPSMPVAVAARLDATLADLQSAGLPSSGHIAAPSAAGTAAGASAAGGGPSQEAAQEAAAARRESVRRLDQLELARDRRRRRLSRSLGAVAAAVAVIAAGASVTAVVRSSTGSSSGAASGAGAAADSASLPAAAAARTHSSGTPLSLPPSYDQDTLRAALPSIAERSAVEIITGEGDTGPAGAMADAGRRTACAGTIGGGRGRLRAVQRIRYQGTPAYVFVFDNGGTRTGVVVADNCGVSSGLPASVLGTVS